MNQTRLPDWQGFGIAKSEQVRSASSTLRINGAAFCWRATIGPGVRIVETA